MGIALAYVAAARGYKLNVTMPETMSIERRKVFSILGANIILTSAAKGLKDTIEEAGRIAAHEFHEYIHRNSLPQSLFNAGQNFCLAYTFQFLTH